MHIRSSDITPEHLYLSRRHLLKGAAWFGGASLLAACAPASTPYVPPTSSPVKPALVASPAKPTNAPRTDELGDTLTPFDSVTNYNNFYEFSTDKQGVAPLSKNFISSPWTVTIGGLVNKPMKIGLEELLKKFTQEERIYRLRCVEAWSMVIPWQGFSLSALLKLVEPKSEAKFVRFETLNDPKQFPGESDHTYNWPYVEGLRIDEAMNDLTTLATGLYGKPLPAQNGAPIRLVVPWKYGFKSIKSVVKIDLVAEQPQSLWMKAGPGEYGFYSNVNPAVNHPRWSQASERRINEASRKRTLMFNGYEAQVGALYTGMDLRKDF